jgi:hypothetical protein
MQLMEAGNFGLVTLFFSNCMRGRKKVLFLQGYGTDETVVDSALDVGFYILQDGAFFSCSSPIS